jgi:hypothetical protein
MQNEMIGEMDMNRTLYKLKMPGLTMCKRMCKRRRSQPRGGHGSAAR